MVLWARGRPAIFPTFSEGRRWTATGVLISRRGPDEGLLPRLPWPVACHAQPRVGRFTIMWMAQARKAGEHDRDAGGEGQEVTPHRPRTSATLSPGRGKLYCAGKTPALLAMLYCPRGAHD
jgi:hypothetical protein